MPKVGKREFDYTPGGVARAANYARKKGMKIDYGRGVKKAPPKKHKGKARKG